MKINVTRIFETSRALATKSGQELQDFVEFVSGAFAQVILALRNNLTFEDNFLCLTQQITLFHNQVQIINTNGKTPKRIMATARSTTQILTGFGWTIGDNGETQIKATFDGSPVAAQNLDLVIFL